MEKHKPVIEQKTEMQKITEYKNSKGKVIRRRVQTFNYDPTMTDQDQEPETNVNNIMDKYMKSGLMPEFRSNGYYADISNVPDLATALQTVNQAQQAFNELPSKIRARFGNSPEAMMEFLKDSSNKEEAISLGLIDAPEAPPEPIKVKVIPDPEPKEKK